MKRKKGQIWIETVIYTVIGLVLIALVLGFVMPKITQARDKLAVEQAINSLQDFDNKIIAVMSKGDGNIRILDLSIKKGNLIIDTSGNSVGFLLENLDKPYSEVNTTISIGSINLISKKNQRAYGVLMNISYNYNITFNGEENLQPKILTPSSIPYRISFTNKDNSVLDISIGD